MAADLRVTSEESHTVTPDEKSAREVMADLETTAQKDDNPPITGIRKFWDVAALAAYLGRSQEWVYRRTAPKAQDRIPHFKFGKYVMFDPESDEFRAWLKETFRN